MYDFCFCFLFNGIVKKAEEAMKSKEADSDDSLHVEDLDDLDSESE